MKTDVHVVSHTHWDREWYLTREQFRLRLVDLVDRVLDLMDADPRFSFFHLDGQTIVLEDYLEVRPEAEARLRTRIAEGRLLVGPWYVMPDMFLVSGEALVRNLALGHRIARRLGGVMPVGYMPDPFGHVAQMPQILRQLGLDCALLWRGFRGERAEYTWESPDGSRVLLLHLPREGYGNGALLPVLPSDEALRLAEEIVARERARSAGGTVLVMVGSDHLEPHPALPDLVAALAAAPGLHARISTLPAYVEAARTAAEGVELPVVRGELRAGEDYAFLLPGVLSTRTYLKQANARAQRTLETAAEPLALLAWLAGEPYPGGLLDYAWKTLLQNHPHDSICGCSIDAVHEENVVRFDRALQVAEGVADRALAALARRVPAPPPDRVRVLAANTDAHPYSGVLTAVVDVPTESLEAGRDEHLFDHPSRFFPPGSRIAGVVDSSGAGVPFQVLGEEETITHLLSRFQPPWPVRARRIRLAFRADAVPPFGYAAFDVRLAASDAPTAVVEPRVAADERSMENALLRVELRDDGGFDVRDKRSGLIFRGGAILEDTGDVGDEYNFCPPDRDLRVTSRLRAARVIEAGPLRAVLRVELELVVPAAAADDRRSRTEDVVTLPVSLDACLEAGAPRVAFSLAVENRARDHRLRVLFPTGAARVDHARADSAFAVVRRPARREVPAGDVPEIPMSTAPLQSVVDAGDGETGATVIGDGLMEYEVVETDGRAAIALTLVRAVGDLSRDDFRTRRGHAGPGLATPGAQCPGRHVFRFAFEPRAAPPTEASLLASARAFLAPPRVMGPAGAEGRLPGRHSFLDVDAAGAVLSACKKADSRDAAVLRFFNPGSAPVRVELRAAGAAALDLLEAPTRDLAVDEGRTGLVLAPGRIETIELKRPRGRPPSS